MYAHYNRNARPAYGFVAGRYARAARCLVLGLVAYFQVAQNVSADFANPSAYDNGEDLRALRRALAGVPEGFEVPVPPTTGDDASSVHGELRAQSLMMEKIGKLLAMLVGIGLFQASLGRIKLK